MRRGGPAFSFFRLMPDELVLEVFRAIDDQRAAAALCLAMPRHGVAATRQGACGGPLFGIAMRLASSSSGDWELILRRYAAGRSATAAGAATLAAWAVDGGQRAQLDLCVRDQTRRWHLVLPGRAAHRAIVRVAHPHGITMHYTGITGEERLVRLDQADGISSYWEGERGAERRVRMVHPGGAVVFSEGAMGEERDVRVVFPDGRLISLEGAAGGALRAAWSATRACREQGHRTGGGNTPRVELPEAVDGLVS